MKKKLGINVLVAARQRIGWVFDNFSRIYCSFSGGKDSTVMLHLVAEEARKRKVKFGLLFVDMEGQYVLTIDHIMKCYELYNDIIEPHWVAVPLILRNAVSQFEPRWICWDLKCRDNWIRSMPKQANLSDKYPFHQHGMEFEEFVLDFGHWFGKGESTACFVGIRADESLNRWRTIASTKKNCFDGKRWTTWCGKRLWNIYPIYDWRVEDLWTWHAYNHDMPYNRLYDRMYQAGLSVHQMRICQPYGDDQRKGLWLFHVIEPETWAKIVARVNGANQGALYAQESGNILGRIKINKPVGHTWESFAMLLLESQPLHMAEHYRNKIAVFIQWWRVKGIYPIPDDGPLDKSMPSWKRICKALLRNDYWCKGLSFSQTKSVAYEKYCKLMKRRRQQWKLI